MYNIFKCLTSAATSLLPFHSVYYPEDIFSKNTLLNSSESLNRYRQEIKNQLSLSKPNDSLVSLNKAIAPAYTTQAFIIPHAETAPG